MSNATTTKGDRVAHPDVAGRQGTVRSLTGQSAVVGWEHHDDKGRLIHITEGWHLATSLKLVEKKTTDHGPQTAGPKTRSAVT